MTIRAILFDKDGTLVDFNATWVGIAKMLASEAAGGDEALARRLLVLSGWDEDRQCFRADSVFAAGTNADVVALWHPELDAEGRRERMIRFDAITAAGGAQKAIPLHGVREALANLHMAGYRLGVATNDSTGGAEQTLLALGIAQLFDAAFGYDAVANPKPAPDVVLAFADMTGLRPSQIAMVGDNRHDMETARAAGAGLAIAVLSGTGTRESLAPHADIVLSSVAELPAYMAGR